MGMEGYLGDFGYAAKAAVAVAAIDVGSSSFASIGYFAAIFKHFAFGIGHGPSMDGAASKLRLTLSTTSFSCSGDAALY